MIKVDVLGTEYTILFDMPEQSMPDDADGSMDGSTKTIKIGHFEVSKNSLQDMENYKRKVVRHEILHAFFMNQDFGSIAAHPMRGDVMNQSLIGLPFSHQRYSRRLRMLMRYEEA
ncbi:hypothetical protein [Emergencia sp. 1XD21-10]|uniref:hypothetical protein n=1 Tax=Emergencia sp. 1XD21-10 TaxID=2304569 RepID=UPI001379E6EF|nr:hypothetical protein [Emergencia sp. 1XD21-10]NCE98416.1 hypothetical protein [Emergencia sp. 1XD21-10]